MNISNAVLTLILGTFSMSAWGEERVEVCRGYCGETEYLNAYHVVSSENYLGTRKCERLSQMPKGFKASKDSDLQCAEYAESMMQSACGMYDSNIENVSCKVYVKP